MEQGKFAYRQNLEAARKALLDSESASRVPDASQQVQVQKEGLMRPRAQPKPEMGGAAKGMGMALMESFQAKEEAVADAEKARAAPTPTQMGDSGLGLSEGSTGRPTARPGSTTPRDMSDKEILALTLQAEAGGEGLDGMLAAGSVIMNRADSGNYGGSNVRDVIMKPGQFSAWNGVTGYAGGEGAIDMNNLKPTKAALRAAEQLLSGQYEDVTGGATHYYNPQVASPKWGGQAGKGWTDIGNHRFGKA
jgi:spore germination cell wall hydrolase CwlJ-like protein